MKLYLIILFGICLLIFTSQEKFKSIIVPTVSITNPINNKKHCLSNKVKIGKEKIKIDMPCFTVPEPNIKGIRDDIRNNVVNPIVTPVSDIAHKAKESVKKNTETIKNVFAKTVDSIKNLINALKNIKIE